MNELVAQNITEKSIQEVFNKHNNIAENLDANYFYQLAQQHPQLQQMDFMNFIHKCILFKADPRKNEIYLIPRSQSYKDANNQWQKKQVGTIVLSYQFFLKKAYESGDLDHFKVDTTIEDYFDMSTMKQVKTLVSTCSVKRMSSSDYIQYKARYHEFVSKDYQGNPTAMWKNKPYLMLEKCAVSNAMRQCFPSILENVYVQEEMAPQEYTTEGHEVKNEVEAIKEKTEKSLENSEVREAMNEETQKQAILEELRTDIARLTNKFKDNEKVSEIEKEIGIDSIRDFADMHLVDLINARMKVKSFFK